MINEEDRWQCAICEKEFSGAGQDEDGNDNPDYAPYFACDECGEEQLCGDCVAVFKNAGVSLCRKCLQVTERIVEKIVEKPVYFNNETTAAQKEETMEEFEKRITMS